MAVQLIGPLKPGVLPKAGPPEKSTTTSKKKSDKTFAAEARKVVAPCVLAESEGNSAEMDDYFSAEETESEDDNNKKPSAIDSTQKMALPKMTVSEIVDAMIASIDETQFVIALQDVGTQVSKKQGKKNRLETTFPKLNQLVATMRKHAWKPFTKKEKDLPEFLQKRPTTRVQIGIVSYLQVKRKKVSIKHVFQSIREIFLEHFPNETEMYALYPEEEELTGLRNVLINHFEELRITYNEKTGNINSRTPNDAARLVCIMLDENHRQTVDYWLSNKRTREEQDLGVSHKDASLEDFAKLCFNNPDYVAKGPEDTGPLEWDTMIDPNDVSISGLFIHQKIGLTHRVTAYLSFFGSLIGFVSKETSSG
jgi:hypothetical protein